MRLLSHIVMEEIRIEALELAANDSRDIDGPFGASFEQWQRQPRALDSCNGKQRTIISIIILPA